MGSGHFSHPFPSWLPLSAQINQQFPEQRGGGGGTGADGGVEDGPGPPGGNRRRKKWEASENLVAYRGRYSDFLYFNSERKGSRREMAKRRRSCSTEAREVEHQCIACDLCASAFYEPEL